MLSGALVVSVETSDTWSGGSADIFLLDDNVNTDIISMLSEDEDGTVSDLSARSEAAVEPKTAEPVSAEGRKEEEEEEIDQEVADTHKGLVQSFENHAIIQGLVQHIERLPANDTSLQDKIITQLNAHQQEKQLDAAVAKSVAHTLETHMALKDEEESTVSKDEVAKEVVKMTPAFQAKQAIDALNVINEAKDLEKDDLFKLAKEDEAETHVSKKELAAEIANLAGSLHSSPEKFDEQMDRTQDAISHAGIMSVAVDVVSGRPLKNQHVGERQAAGTLFKMDKKDAIKAFLQGQTDPLNLQESKLANAQSIESSLSQTGKRMAAKQADGMNLSSGEKRAASYQAKDMPLSRADRLEAKREAQGFVLTDSEKKNAAQQSELTVLTGKEVIGAQMQSTQRLHKKDAAEAKRQASQVSMTKAESTMAKAQSVGDKFSASVRAESNQISRTRLFADTKSIQHMAVEQATASLLNTEERKKAASQAEMLKVTEADLDKSRQQAANPKITNAVQKEARALSQQPALVGALKQLAVSQANMDELTGKITPQEIKAAEKQASFAQAHDVRYLREAVRQEASPSLTSRDEKFSLKQMNSMYGMSKEQAVDTISQMTNEKHEKSVRQVDDHLKYKDEVIARKQASEGELSLQDQWDAAHQASDKGLWHLAQKDARWAHQQIESAFDGKLSEEDAKLAEKLADDAEKKQQKFEANFQAWREAKEEAKIRAQFAQEKTMMLGESANVKKAVSAKKLKKAPAKIVLPALSLEEFQRKLMDIKKETENSVSEIRKSTEMAEILQPITLETPQ